MAAPRAPMIVSRIDRAPGRIDIVDALEAPTPERSPAVRHPEGYLEVDAYLARDGLLRYSDGRDSWLEYRPRSELEAAAASWAHAPVTDDHPARMVSAADWREVARGIVMGAPVVTEPGADGISYLRGRLLIADREMITRIEGGQRELSIGFTSRVVPTSAGVAADGTRCDAVQTALDGNHVASVARGRAGPAVRVLLDGKDVACHFPLDSAPPGSATQLTTAQRASTQRSPMQTKTPPTTPPARADELGAPVTMAKIVAPDGGEIEVPTWVAAAVEQAAELREELAQLKTKTPAPAPAPAAPKPAPAAPTPDAAAPTPDAAAAPAAPPSDAPEDEEDDEKMTPDSVEKLVQARQARLTRLVRLADRAGVPAAICDSADPIAIGRAFVIARMPSAKALAEKADAAALDVLVDAAAAIPEPAAPPVHRNPFQRERKRVDAAEAAASPVAKFMSAQGYTA